MTLAELLAKLETLEDGAVMVETIKAETSRLNAEAKKYREAKEAAEATVKTLTVEKEDLQKKYDEISVDGSGKNTAEYKALEQRIDGLVKSLEKEKTARAEEAQKRIASEMLAQTVNALTKGNALDPNEFAKLMMPNIKATESGEFRYYGEDGAEMTIEEGANAWLKARSWAVRDTQKAGSGDSGKPPAGGRSVEPVTLRDAISSALTANGIE